MKINNAYIVSLKQQFHIPPFRQRVTEQLIPLYSTQKKFYILEKYICYILTINWLANTDNSASHHSHILDTTLLSSFLTGHYLTILIKSKHLEFN